MISLLAVVIWLAVLCGLATAETSSPLRWANVILFLVDDMGWMDTPYGSKYYDTPNIQRLAEQGMRFTQADKCVAVVCRGGALTRHCSQIKLAE